MSKIPPEAFGYTEMDTKGYFSVGWPEGLESGEFYETPSDDDPDTRLQVLVSPADGDVHVGTVTLEGSTFVRICTLAGGGYHHTRTRSALLMLALAIKLDNEEAATP